MNTILGSGRYFSSSNGITIISLPASRISSFDLKKILDDHYKDKYSVQVCQAVSHQRKLRLLLSKE